MNAQCYRVIFNKARGMLMVVSEAARAQGTTGNPASTGSDISQVAASSQTLSTAQSSKLDTLRSHLLLALGLASIVGISNLSYADNTQIIADQTAAKNQQASIINTSNGMTQVNIQTPSKAGVSRNVFSQFDVGADGAILNNSRTNTQTQMAGWVEGNPWLARGEANVILNEVNSSDPSKLNGFTEIAGQRAELVIANPAGISCSGCGFINASRTILSTGEAMMTDGMLTGFDVQGGLIRVDGTGMNSSDSDYTQLIAKTAQLNANIAAKNLDVITGTNQVSYDSNPENTKVTNTTGSTTNSQTGVALDVSNLGGMYAGKIRLIGTDKGMGVTNAGSIMATSGTLQLDANGNLVNTGSLMANQGQVDIDVNNNQINNSGTIASSRSGLHLSSDSLDNTGVISSYDTAKLQQVGSIKNSGKEAEISAGSFDITAASLTNTGKLLQTGQGNLSIETATLDNHNNAIIGQNLYPKAATEPSEPEFIAPTTTPPTSANNGSNINSSDLNSTDDINAGSEPDTNPEPLPTITKDGSIKVDTLSNTDLGSIYANGKMDIQSNTLNNTQQSSIGVSSLAINDNGSVNNNYSRIQLDDVNWKLASFDNSKGQIITNSGINIDSVSDINNAEGSLASVADINLTTTKDIDNHSGIIQSNDLNVVSKNLNNNEGHIKAQGTINIDSSGNFINNKGSISSAKDTTITSDALSNDDGHITLQGRLTTNVANLNNSGQLYGKTKTTISATDAITNSGTVASGGHTDIQAGSLTQTSSGNLVAGLDTQGKLIEGSVSNLTVNTAGNIISQGQHIATGDVSLTGADVNLEGSTTQGQGITTKATVGSVNTKYATLAATDSLSLHSEGTLDNTQGNLRGQVLDIKASALNNTDGKLTQTGSEDLTLDLDEGINNTRGEIASHSDNLTINTSELINTEGRVQSTNNLLIAPQNIDNSRGIIAGNNVEIATVNQTLTNHQGTVFASEDLTIKNTNIDNTDGTIQANNKLSINAEKQNIINNNTLEKGIIAQGDLQIIGLEISNDQGFIGSNGAIRLNGDAITNSEGKIISEQDVNVEANTLNNGAGVIGGVSSIDIKVRDLDNNKGTIDSKDTLKINAQGRLNNQEGLISSEKSVLIQDDQDNRQLNIDNKDGTIIAKTSNKIITQNISGDGALLSYQDLDIDTVANFIQSKSLKANGNITFKTLGNFTNQNNVEASQSVGLSIGGYLNNLSKIQANNTVNIATDTIDNASTASILANAIYISARENINNKGDVEANSSLNIDSKELYNAGKLVADMNVGDLVIRAKDSVINTGLINAGDVTIKSENISNSEKIFGGRIALQADSIINGRDNTAALSNVNGGNNTSGSIASRGDLVLAGNDILNEEDAILFAQGNLQVGKSLDDTNQAIGLADKLTNASADINVMGDANLNATNILNLNRYLKTGTEVTKGSEAITLFSKSEGAEEYTADQVRLWRTWNIKDPSSIAYLSDTSDFGWFPNRTKTFRARWGIEFPDGELSTSHYRKWFTEDQYKTIVTSSQPGSIHVGGDLSFSDSLTNQDSEIIVGGSVISDSGSQVVNQSTEGSLILKRTGMQEDYWIVRDNNGHKSSRWESRKNTRDYDQVINKPISLNTTTFIENSSTNIVQTDVELSTVTQSNIVGTSTDSTDKLAEDYQVSNGQREQSTIDAQINSQPFISSVENTQINNQTTADIIAGDATTIMESNSLYAITPDSNARYLIETDPDFASYKNWLSSDYMMQRLNLDPTVTHKRLGDGFYEQRLVQDQIAQLTGHRFLNDFTSDDTQYQALMDNGITFANRINLRPGIALSASQVAMLTSDIVWLVNHKITLEDGTIETVLAPKVYLKPSSDMEIRADGSLISAGKGFNLTLDGDFDNISGVVQGRDTISINSKNINNIAGKLTSNRINLNAVNNITNQNGEIRAVNTLNATAGGDITAASTVSHNSDGSRQTLDRIAGFYVDDAVAGNLNLTANKNIIITAANVINSASQGKTTLNAKEDIKLGTVTTGFNESMYVDKDNQRHVTVSEEIGSQIISGGGISLNAGKDINGKRVTVDSKNSDININAANNVEFTNGINQQAVDLKRSWETGALIGDKEHTQQIQSTSNKSISSQLSANNITINSGQGNVRLIGTNADTMGRAEVTAQNGTVTITSVVNRSTQSNSESSENFYKETGSQQGFEKETLNQTGISGSSVYINGQNVEINAANLQAKDGTLQIGDATLATDNEGNLKLDDNGKPIVLAGSIDNLDLGTIELENREWDEKQKGYKGIAKVGMQVAGAVGGALGITDGITISKSSGHDTTITSEEVSTLEGKNVLIGGNTVNAKGTQITATAEGAQVVLLGNNINLGVATTTTITDEYDQKEVVGGEGIKFTDDSLQLGAIIRTDIEDSTNITTGTNQGVTINSDNITVLGGMDNGTLTTTAATLNANPETGNLVLGAKTTILDGIENTQTVTNNNTTDTTKVSAEVRHIAVDAVKAAEQVKEAASALAAAKNELRDAKDRAARGELSQDAIKDYEINLAAATVNLANAQINLGSTATAAAGTSLTGGFSASANAEHSKTTSTDTHSIGTWQGTELNAANATFVGDDFTVVGGTANLGTLNIDNLNNLTLTSGANSTTTSSNSKTNAQTASINTAGNVGLGLSTQKSDSQSLSTTQTNTNLNVGSLKGHADTTTLNGGRIDISGASEGSYTTNKLYIETVQNTSESSNNSSGANIGITANIATGTPIPTGGSLGANKAKGSSQSSIASEQSGIIDRGNNQSITVGDTTNIGGIIANIQTDSKGNQSSGTLNFTTDTLTTQDITNTATNEQRSIGGSIGVGTGQQGQSINNLGVQVGHTANEFESKTLATVGEGAIVTSDSITGKDSLAGVNRDALNTEIIIKDQQTAGLDIDANIDARVFTEAGRDEIIDEQKELGKNAKKITAITVSDALKAPAIIAAITDDGNKNPDSFNKSTLDKVKDNITQIGNNNRTGISDDIATLVATEELIVTGDITNDVVAQDTYNQLASEIASGTDAQNANVYVTPDLTESRAGELGTIVLGSANETTKQDIYLDRGALDRSDSVTVANGQVEPIVNAPSTINVLNEEIAHTNGQGEASASTMGNLGEIAYNVGKWANSGDIAEAKESIDTTAINNANTAQEQQEMLAENKERLETQQEAGDVFEDQPYYKCDPVFGCMPPHQLEWARENPQEWAKRNKQFNKFLEYVYEDIFLYTLDGASGGKASSASVAAVGSVKVISKGGRKFYQVIKSGEVFTFDYKTVNKLIDKGQRNFSEAILSVARVKPVNSRMPINAKYANRTIPLADLPKDIRNKYPHSVPFNGAGYPDFSRYSIKNVRITFGKTRKTDFDRADKAAGYTSSNPRPDGYTWHHHQDAGYMQLIPTDLHDAIKHTGGIATAK